MYEVPRMLTELALRSVEPFGWLTGVWRLATGKVREVESLHERRDPDFIRRIMPLFEWAAREWYDLEVLGDENIPRHGPVLVVGNHNSAMVPPEFSLFYQHVWNSLGPQREIYGLAHDMVVAHPWLSEPICALGAIRAGHDNARRAFDKGAMVVVYPGGDTDTFRPTSMRNTIVLNRRMGFIRLALRTGVPILPKVARGAHESLYIFSDGRKLAKMLGWKRFLRTETIPIVLNIPWGLTVGYLPYIPMPCEVELALGKPISWPELGPEAADDNEIVERCYRQVEGTMQGMMDWLVARRAGDVSGDDVPVFDLPAGARHE